jgi:hypothetical protein
MGEFVLETSFALQKMETQSRDVDAKWEGSG